jgi:hypothetical protein
VQLRRFGFSAAADVAPCPRTIRRGSYFNAGVPTTRKYHPHAGKGAPASAQSTCAGLFGTRTMFLKVYLRGESWPEGVHQEKTSRSGEWLFSDPSPPVPFTWDWRQVLPCCSARTAIHRSTPRGNEDQIGICPLHGASRRQGCTEFS